MRWGEDAVDVVYECIAHNIPISNITAAQSGATAPRTDSWVFGAIFGGNPCQLGYGECYQTRPPDDFFKLAFGN